MHFIAIISSYFIYLCIDDPLFVYYVFYHLHILLSDLCVCIFMLYVTFPDQLGKVILPVSSGSVLGQLEVLGTAANSYYKVKLKFKAFVTPTFHIPDEFLLYHVLV